MAFGGYTVHVREACTFFVQELFEYVLQEFGHEWRASRTDREIRLRRDSVFTFTPQIGLVVTYLSRKHGHFVIAMSYHDWKYIRTHKSFVIGDMLSTAIQSLCRRCQVEDDDFGLFDFLAIVCEFARFVLIDGQENLMEEIVDILCACIVDIIPGSFPQTLERLQYRADTFEPPAVITISDSCALPSAPSEVSFKTVASSVSLNTRRSEDESPLSSTFEFHTRAPCSTTMEEIEDEFQKRESHRERFRRELGIDNLQGDVADNPPRASDLDSALLESEDMEASGNADKVGVQVKSQDSSVQTKSQMNEMEGTECGGSGTILKNAPSRSEDEDRVNKDLETMVNIIQSQKLDEDEDKSKPSPPNTKDSEFKQEDVSSGTSADVCSKSHLPTEKIEDEAEPQVKLKLSPSSSSISKGKSKESFHTQKNPESIEDVDTTSHDSQQLKTGDDSVDSPTSSLETLDKS